MASSLVGVFGDDGLIAFGRAKRLVCMDGLDFNDMLDRALSFAEVIRFCSTVLGDLNEAAGAAADGHPGHA